MRKKKNRLPPFVAIFQEMLKSKAWEKISNPARVAFVHLKSKCVSYEILEITLSYDEMEKIMGRRTFAKAIRDLDEYGFITRTQRGGLHRKRNYFLLSDEWRKIN